MLPPLQPKEDPMDHAATVRRLYDLINAGDIDGFGALLADDFVDHEELPVVGTREGVMDFLRMQRAAFPDMRMHVEEVIESGDTVVVRGKVSGTHEGTFLGMPATGRHMEVKLIDIMRFGDDGLAHEHWGLMDSLAMMQQLGALPEGPAA
jgi:steroid delta-isomerase-like uncharacterized protein